MLANVFVLDWVYDSNHLLHFFHGVATYKQRKPQVELDKARTELRFLNLIRQSPRLGRGSATLGLARGLTSQLEG